MESKRDRNKAEMKKHKKTTGHLQTNTLAWGEGMHFALVTNVLVLETNTLKARVQTSAQHSYTCSYSVPAIFKQNFSRNCYILTGTHLRKRVVATLSYSPASTLHPQVIYTIAFSAGLNSLQVD